MLALLREADNVESSTARIIRGTIADFRKEVVGIVSAADDFAFSATNLTNELDAVAERYRVTITGQLQSASEASWVRGIDDTQDTFALFAAFDEVASLSVPVVTSPELIESLSAASAERVVGITSDMKSRLARHVQKVALSQTFDAGVKAVSRDLKGLRSIFKTTTVRAEAIVQTEVARVYATAAEAQIQEGMRQDSNIVTQWMHATTPVNPRPAHVRLHLTTKKQGEKFIVNGFPATMPHDPNLPASEVVRCSCRAVANYLIDDRPIDLPGLSISPGPADTLVYKKAS